MQYNELVSAFKKVHQTGPDSPNSLFDFCQKLYIYGQLSSQNYRKLRKVLHEKGATSAHDTEEIEKATK
ncbi:YppF family protein [Bacillaceae bacterium S4-13-58]